MEMWTRVTLLVKNKLFMDTVINLAFGKSTITPLEVPYVYIFFFSARPPRREVRKLPKYLQAHSKF